ncbi:MAG TPA: ABC transporter permease [Puia sp.]|nr:ABC transporter permease [Puia sp.]
MLRNYIVTAFRNLVRNKTYSIINIAGLAVGIAIFLLIAQYVHFEKSYEDFIPGRDNIYRVSLERWRNNQLVLASAENYPAVGPAMRHDLPEVMDYARLYFLGYKNNVMITNEQANPSPIVLKQRLFFYADSSFLPMMGYPMLRGDARQALAQPFTAVLSETCARSYFGNADPIGQALHMHDDDFNDELVTVTGVFKDLPANTHLKFDVLFSYRTLLGRKHQGNPAARFEQSWQRADMYTFVRLKPGTDVKATQTKLATMMGRYKPGLEATHEKELLGLQPLASIHLHSDLAEEPEINGNADMVFFLGLIGIFVLFIAWINFINLSTARAITRAREVGVRKVIGASRGQLVARFMAEAALTNLFALVIAYILVYLILPGFNAISGLSLDHAYLIQPWFFALISVIGVAGTFFSGFYPSWVLSSFRPAAVLKGTTRKGGGIRLRQGLVVGQFVASFALIAGTVIVYRQLHYLLTQPLGMDINQVIVMDRPGIAPSDRTEWARFAGEIDLFRNELKKHPEILGVSNSTSVPGMLREWKETIRPLSGSSRDSIVAISCNIDYDFIPTYKMRLLAGRGFSRDYPKDPDTSVVLTATAARLLGFQKPEDAVGKTVAINSFSISGMPDYFRIVVGVVNDYHQVSLKKAMEPGIFECDNYESEYYSIRIHTADLPKTIADIRQAWTTAFPGNPFEYRFLDEYFNRQYTNDHRFGELFSVFAALAILISCMGLLGLSAYIASQRIKEVGIRRVLGATVTGITLLLSRDFLKLTILAVVLSTPLTWLIMSRWLADYAYRVNMPWWIFAGAGCTTVLIALVTVSVQAVRAALANPAASLRSEG